MPVIALVVATPAGASKVVPSAITADNESVFSEGIVTHVVVATRPMSVGRLLACGVCPTAVATTMRNPARWTAVPAPPGLPTVIGTVVVTRYASGAVDIGRTWTWGPYTNAPTITAYVAITTRRGQLGHHYHTCEQNAPRCALCMTRHTTGGRTCHRCIVAGVDVATAPLFGGEALPT